MGVDKSDIRTVVHLEAPATAEAYIQEAGRGGRDGKVSKAILLWDGGDAKKFGAFGENSRGRVLYDFAEKGTCRRQVLLDALGGERAACSGCDVCEGTAERFARDAEFARGFLRRRVPAFADEAAISRAADGLLRAMNRRAAESLGRRIWEHGDALALIDAASG
jgi:ATP-dependent DNA helicase RecQ